MTTFDRRRFLAASAAGAAFAAAPPALAQAQSSSTPTSDSVASLPQPDGRKGEYFEHDGAKIFYQKIGI